MQIKGNEKSMTIMHVMPTQTTEKQQNTKQIEVISHNKCVFVLIKSHASTTGLPFRHTLSSSKCAVFATGAGAMHFCSKWKLSVEHKIMCSTTLTFSQRNTWNWCLISYCLVLCCSSTALATSQVMNTPIEIWRFRRIPFVHINRWLECAQRSHVRQRFVVLNSIAVKLDSIWYHLWFAKIRWTLHKRCYFQTKHQFVQKWNRNWKWNSQKLCVCFINERYPSNWNWTHTKCIYNNNEMNGKIAEWIS